MDEQHYCTDPVLGDVLRQYLRGSDEDIPGDIIKDALFHLQCCRACEEEHPDAVKDSHGWWAAIIGNRVPVGPNETRAAEYHWRSCDRCQQESPYGLSQLASIRIRVEEDVKRDILKLYHEYESTRHAMLAGMGEASKESRNEAGAGILACLAKKAANISYGLEFFHEMGGLTYLSVFPDADDSEAMQAWRGINSLIRAVPKEVQRFIFGAMLCAEVLGRNLNEEGHVEKTKDGLKDYTSWWGQLRTVEAASAQLLREYLEENPEPPAADFFTRDNAASGASANLLLRQVKDLLAEFGRGQEDRFASFEAVNMGVFQAVDRIDRKPSECERVLRDELGPTYDLLLPATKEHLQQGEWDFSHAQASPGYGNAVLNFALAFETEFITKIAEPVARELSQRFGSLYQPEKALAPFVEGGVLYPKLGLGNYLWYMRDPNVKQIVTGLGTNPDKLRQALYRLSPFRNDTVHPPTPTSPKGGCEVQRPISPERATEVREMILGPGSILRLLIPVTGSA